MNNHKQTEFDRLAARFQAMTQSELLWQARMWCPEYLGHLGESRDEILQNLLAVVAVRF